MQFLRCSVKIFLSDVHACLSEVEKIERWEIEISVMELNSVKPYNLMAYPFFISSCSKSNTPDITHSHFGRLPVVHPWCKLADDVLPAAADGVFGSYPGARRPYMNSKSSTSLGMIKFYTPVCVP